MAGMYNCLRGQALDQSFREGLSLSSEHSLTNGGWEVQAEAEELSSFGSAKHQALSDTHSRNVVIPHHDPRKEGLLLFPFYRKGN